MLPTYDRPRVKLEGKRMLDNELCEIEQFQGHTKHKKKNSHWINFPPKMSNSLKVRKEWSKCMITSIIFLFNLYTIRFSPTGIRYHLQENPADIPRETKPPSHHPSVAADSWSASIWVMWLRGSWAALRDLGVSECLRWLTCCVYGVKGYRSQS